MQLCLIYEDEYERAWSLSSLKHHHNGYQKTLIETKNIRFFSVICLSRPGPELAMS
jgi:hypothetical protein